jgi:hypothetical protein
VSVYNFYLQLLSPIPYSHRHRLSHPRGLPSSDRPPTLCRPTAPARPKLKYAPNQKEELHSVSEYE